MRKIFATALMAAVFISCNDSASSSSSEGQATEEDKKAGYIYGMNVGDQVLDFTAGFEDPLDADELERGIRDYLKMNETKRQSYATGQNIGLSISSFITSQNLKGKIDPRNVVEGVMDVVRRKDTKFEESEVEGFMQQYLMSNMEKIQQENQEASTDFLADIQKEENVSATESGLLYEVIEEGAGESPDENSTVEVRYTGTTMDGVVFDETQGEETRKFPLRGVIQGWQEGLQMMKPGAKYKLYIPGHLAYGEYGSPDGKIKPNDALVFEVELVSVEEPTSAAAAPEFDQ